MKGENTIPHEHTNIRNNLVKFGARAVLGGGATAPSIEVQRYQNAGQSPGL